VNTPLFARLHDTIGAARCRAGVNVHHESVDDTLDDED
jgi:hypothetical protein